MSENVEHEKPDNYAEVHNYIYRIILDKSRPLTQAELAIILNILWQYDLLLKEKTFSKTTAESFYKFFIENHNVMLGINKAILDREQKEQTNG